MDVTSKVEVLEVSDPPERQAGIIVENVEELVGKLKQDGLI